MKKFIKSIIDALIEGRSKRVQYMIKHRIYID